MSTIFWVLLPILIALGSALLALGIWQQRLEAQLDRERQALTVTLRFIEDQKNTYEKKHRSRSTAAGRDGLAGFLADLHSEQRHFVRDEKKGSGRSKLLVMQERLYFRNIPLTHWLEHEVPLEEGVSVEEVAKTLSVFDLEDRTSDSGSGARQTNALKFHEG